jgi:2-haloacid dehalogenase
MLHALGAEACLPDLTQDRERLNSYFLGTDMLHLQPVQKVITFDCYGTLVQWHSAVRSAARAVLSSRLPDAEAGERSVALADRLRSAAVERQQRAPFCDYKAVHRSALASALTGAGFTAKP